MEFDLVWASIPIQLRLGLLTRFFNESLLDLDLDYCPI
jgi:hypothetical protein